MVWIGVYYEIYGNGQNPLLFKFPSYMKRSACCIPTHMIAFKIFFTFPTTVSCPTSSVGTCRAVALSSNCSEFYVVSFSTELCNPINIAKLCFSRWQNICLQCSLCFCWYIARTGKLHFAQEDISVHSQLLNSEMAAMQQKQFKFKKTVFISKSIFVYSISEMKGS